VEARRPSSTPSKRRSWPKRLFAGGAYDQGKPMSKAASRGVVIDVVRRADHSQARPT
jgi:hypothetical protein